VNSREQQHRTEAKEAWMNTYRAAVVGLSGIGTGSPAREQRYPVLGMEWPHSHVAAYVAYQRTEVVAVCDIKPEMVDRFRATWGEVLPAARTYLDYREMLAREEIDLLSVVTSDHRHAQIVIDAAERGVKGILCEKPLATTLAEADAMIAAGERNGVALTVNHSRRWRPHWIGARSLVGDGPLGPVRRIAGTWAGRRAMLFRNGGHLIDTICWFAGSEPESVVGILDEEHRHHPPRYAGDGGRDPALDPGGTGLVYFRNGVRAFVNCSKGIEGGGVELEVFCARGHLRVDDVSAEIVSVPQGGSSHDRTRTAVPALVTSLGETPGSPLPSSWLCCSPTPRAMPRCDSRYVTRKLPFSARRPGARERLEQGAGRSHACIGAAIEQR
jgi:predicted dehydrogenase